MIDDHEESIDSNGALPAPGLWVPGAESAAVGYADEYALNDIGLALRLHSEGL